MQPNEMQKNKKSTAPSVETKNRFSVLQNIMDVDPEVNVQQAHVTQSENKIIMKKLLPLVMHGTVSDHKKFMTLIKNVVKHKFHIKYNGDSVSVFVQSTTDFDNLKRTWKEKSLSFHMYTKKEERKRVYVIKGLHGETTTEEIKIELQKQDIKTDNITKMKGTSRPLYMVTVPISINLKHLQAKIQYVCSTKIYWCNYIVKRRITQCHNCQEWGHSTTNCFAEPACLKCAGKHHTRECTKPRTDPAKCVNCNNNHPANATICITYQNRITWLERNKPPEITQQTKVKPNSNNSHIIDVTHKEQFPELGNSQHGRPATVTTHL